MTSRADRPVLLVTRHSPARFVAAWIEERHGIRIDTAQSEAGESRRLRRLVTSVAHLLVAPFRASDERVRDWPSRFGTVLLGI